ncbi:RecQ family ATP-dependent DNA helicase [Desulfitobacterium chlororespirans]|uniref:DNA 3'-5' helicase n=1 Tax=Desulfitobacterium chlororespirans DSM 11544 TaxID=1121395 RepID=A0A1M7RWF5_9FIRM|nr:RecQ family ATP-dependent DNA helicase [Desulfitobacterium chlororespirans]SHN50613.1 ATP-dependent DNA helicase RecQ [Desulfitobacterium chlororespirans DSM 11544]
MKLITFIDTEIDPKSKKILDIGSVKGDGSTFHSNSVAGFASFLKGSEYLCGHNILNHDLRYLENTLHAASLNTAKIIDTLYLSPLLFPNRPYHALLKDDKLQTEDANNPLNDSIKARDLFFDEVTTFQQADSTLKVIFYMLLKGQKEFSAFFHFIGYQGNFLFLEKLIREKFQRKICAKADLAKFIDKYPVELAYCLALLNATDRYSITPPWVLKNYPAAERIIFLLRSNPCLEGCAYCNEALDIHQGLKRFFGFSAYRAYGGEPLQEKAVQAAVANKSLLAVFPTGGGKSITFQVPALMSGVNTKGLTVVISPLQSLMKDQVDNLERAGITEAVTINGLLDPIERAKSYERVENGSASLLYISPESLRSKTIEGLLLGRNVVRFVIDEAHCFSAWGQDFRVDYLYIGDFIKVLQEKKGLSEGIPVSCFTATAKQKVIEDIRSYFQEKLSLDLEVFSANASRVNLRYEVFEKNEEEKYNALRDLLEGKKCPTIVYMTRTHAAYALAERLSKDGYQAKPYHGKMDKQEKSANQDAFIQGQVQIMVATSAFGMGVDKKDVGMVIHYEISNSLENYIQEAGRAGRDEEISADCYVLFNDEDLSKHFVLLNQTKLSIQEIQQVWKAIKELTRFRPRVSQSALEIARKAGWDDTVMDIETRVKTAITALEEAGYIRRGQNVPRIFANSILSRTVIEALEKIEQSRRMDERQRGQAVRIIKKLFSSKSGKHLTDEEAESRVDYISDHLGIPKGEVIEVVNLLREEKVLADHKDLAAYIKKSENRNRSLNVLKTFCQIEKFLLTVIENQEIVFHIKELNEQAEEKGCSEATPGKLRTILNFWTIKNWIRRQTAAHSRNHIAVMALEEKEILEAKLEQRYELAQFILEYLFAKTNSISVEEGQKDEVLVEFSVLELKEEYENRSTLFRSQASVKEIEDALYYLSKIEAIKIEGGFMITYQGLTIERLEQNNRKNYKTEDYQKLEQFYQNKVQQVHIVGEYARKMIRDYQAALQFVDDYFRLNVSIFLNKYFPGSRQNEIKRNITPAKFKQLFGELSPTQLKIINDRESQHIIVAAGPGSGKTRILVHKLASLLLMEDVKHEQLLMVTFSRAASNEFKKRLLNLIGNAANYVEIKTFHSYCFDLLGKVGTLEKSDEIIQETIKRIKNGDVEPGRITKTVLVIDEAQDMDAHEFALINALMDRNEEMRVIAVGDDDQNIYEFRGASSEYMVNLILEKRAKLYELVENYRSKSNLVDFSNQFAERIPLRLKDTPIIAHQSDLGAIKLVCYCSNHLITPLVQDILSAELAGTTCILTKSNEEALQITGLLVKNGLQAKLIQSNDGFSLYNLLEVRFFLSWLGLAEGIFTISVEVWNSAKRKLKERFACSLNYELCVNLIREFEVVHPKLKYKSDLEIFIRESKLEDFLGGDSETIFVSTIHKAKGREFDNVFLMLENFSLGTEEAVRQLYVAMTRAKRNLTIHYNGNYLDRITAEGLEQVKDSEEHLPPRLLAWQLTFKDIWLDFFCYPQHQQRINKLTSGDELTFDGEGCRNSAEQLVLKFSQKFRNQLESIRQRGYTSGKARIRFIVYWLKEGTEQEVRIVLPELYFERE